MLTKPGAGLVNDPEPFNPKVVTYEIIGNGRGRATINYLDLDDAAEGRRRALPWELTLTTTEPVGQREHHRPRRRRPASPAESRSTTRSRDERSPTGVNAQTFCLVKSA